MDEESFPIVTFLLATLMLGTFLFTHNNLERYEDLLGFSPSKITPYSVLTYTFIHVDYFHLFTNMIFLLIAGLSLEERIGSLKFSIIYFVSAIFAVLLDILSRYSFGISPTVPFVGASGAVFGSLAVAALVNPSGKVPIGVIFATFIPFLQLIPFGSSPILAIFSNPIFIIFVAVVLIVITTYTIPIHLPLNISISILIISWFTSFLIRYPIGVSNLGHLGGIAGGVISFLLLARTK